MRQKLLLMILDGWGVGNGGKEDVIAQASTPFMDTLHNNPTIGFTTLRACGEDVGLPQGQMGNSEVGHLNIGAGRIIYQDLVRISQSIQDGSLENNEVLREAFRYAKDQKKKVHFLGLVSDGGVHASTPHLYKLIEIAEASDLKDIYIHVLTDGRDTDPYSGKTYVSELSGFIENKKTQIASICGRFYTMDRDKRWERVKRGYDLLVHGTGKSFPSAVSAIEYWYDQKITDEFIEPSVITDLKGIPLATIDADDVVVCFNFRTDRLREITTALTQKDLPEHHMKSMPLHYLTLTVYDDSYQNIRVIFDKEIAVNTLGEIIEQQGLKQLRIAETEKYPHVTFFFSGGRENPFEREQRIMIPSPRDVATYDLKPSMSAPEIAQAVIGELDQRNADFICLNFANGDMVGHTGNYLAIKKAVETVDQCVEAVVNKAVKNGYAIVVTADHGNADNAINPDGTPNTAHSLNDVPFFLLNTPWSNLHPGRLADIAPTILKVMGLPIPKEMTGKILIKDI